MPTAMDWNIFGWMKPNKPGYDRLPGSAARSCVIINPGYTFIPIGDEWIGGQ